MFSLLAQSSSNIIIPSPLYSLALPEMVMLSMICIILLLDLFLNERTRVITYLLTQATLAGLAIYTVMNFAGVEKVTTFSDSFVRDAMGDVLKISIYVIGILVFAYSRDYLKARDLYKGEYFVLGLLGILGMMIMISSYSFLSMYLGLEVLALSMYAMVAFNRDNAQASEAAIKYFVLGAIASGMLLYGMSMIYGVTGEIGFTNIFEYVKTNGASLTLSFGLVFIIIGIAFKLGAVPFHMWVPDVYEGAPTSVTMYLGSIPKIAAFAMMMRILSDGLQPLFVNWQELLIVLAVLSMAIGNIVAIAQTNLKRMLAYSTIAHVGFILLGVLTATPEGYSAAMFYTIIYAFTAVAAFGMILVMSRKGFEAENLDDYKGLNERSPWFAFVVMLVMFSLAGVPPTVGFFAKLLVLQAAIGAEFTWLALVAVFFSIIGAFYYIRIIKLMYFDKAEDTHKIAASNDTKVLISINGVTILALGLYPFALIEICNSALKVTA